MSDKRKPWRERDHQRRNKKIVPLRTGNDKRISPLRVKDEEEFDPRFQDWDQRDQERW